MTMQTFSIKKMHLKMSSAKCQQFRLGLNVLRILWAWISNEFILNLSAIQSLHGLISLKHNQHPIACLWQPFMVNYLVSCKYELCSIFASQWQYMSVMVSEITMPLDYLFKRFFRPTAKKTSKLGITGSLCGEPTFVEWWIPHTKGQSCGKSFHATMSSCWAVIFRSFTGLEVTQFPGAVQYQ